MWDGVSLDCAQALPWSLLVLDIQMFYSCGGQLSLLVHIWLKISNPVPKSFIHHVKTSYEYCKVVLIACFAEMMLS